MSTMDIINETTEKQLLVFSLGDYPVAIDLDKVQLIQLVNEIVPIPRAPDHIIGVANIENSVIPLVDLEVLLTIRDYEIGKNGIVVIISLEETVFGLYMFDLPRVISRDELADPEEHTNIYPVPDSWITSYVNLTEEVEQELQEEEGFDIQDEWIPVISADKFWVSLGDTQILGPAIKKVTVDREERERRKAELLAQQEEEQRKLEEEEQELEDEEGEDFDDEDFDEEQENVEVVEDDEIDAGLFDEEQDDVTPEESEIDEDLQAEDDLDSSDDQDEGEDDQDEGEDDQDESEAGQEDDGTTSNEIGSLTSVRGVTSDIINQLIQSGYNSLENLKDISKEELLEIEGIGDKTADKILEKLSNLD